MEQLFKLGDLVKVTEQASRDLNATQFINQSGKIIDFNWKQNPHTNSMDYFYCLAFKDGQEYWFDQDMLINGMDDAVSKLGDTKRNNNQSLKIFLCLDLILSKNLDLDIFKDILNDTEYYYIKKVLKRIQGLNDNKHISNEDLQKLREQQELEEKIKHNYFNEDDESYWD